MTVQSLATSGPGGSLWPPSGSGAASAGTSSNLSLPFAESPTLTGLNASDLNLSVPYSRETIPMVHPGQLDYAPLSDYMSLAMRDPEHIKELKAQLYAAHLYDSSFYSQNAKPPSMSGTADDDFVSALKKAALEAVRSQGKFSIGEVIQQHTDDINSQTEQQKTTKPPRLTNPDDVKAAVNSASLKVLGKQADPALAQAVSDAYEEMAQKTYTASDGLNNYYSPSASESWIESELKSLRPDDAAAQGTFNNVLSAQQLLSQPTSPFGNLYHA